MIGAIGADATGSAPVASRTILVTCCIVFLWQLTAGPWGDLATRALGFTPAFFVAGGPDDPRLAWTPFAVPLVSYLFLHAGWLHLAGNMLYLWVFGADVEESLGQPGFIVFYLLCGIAAAMAQALPDTTSTVTMIGASGAVSGVLGAFLVLHPRAELAAVVPPFFQFELVRLPAWVVLLAWFAVQVVLEFTAPQAGGGVAFRAHIGGFLAGMLLAPIVLLVSGRRRTRLPRADGSLLR